jgi:hypothetical protein
MFVCIQRKVRRNHGIALCALREAEAAAVAGDRSQAAPATAAAVAAECFRNRRRSLRDTFMDAYYAV